MAPSDENALAVIGLGLRFPGASSAAQLWDNLRNGVESVRAYTDEELLGAGVGRSTLSSPLYVKAGAPIDDFDRFDFRLFGYSPTEAAVLDPQHRIFLECCYEALESAGYATPGREEVVGVYAGSRWNYYLVCNVLQSVPTIGSLGPFQALLANDRDYLATRVAYKLDLRGPALTIQTACSTSLVAIATACEHLLTHQCDVALAGGAAVHVPPLRGYACYAPGMQSPDGHTRSFDADGKGTLFSDGVGVVALKRLPDALADGDDVIAVVRGFAVNNDASRRAGFAAPGLQGQVEVVSLALAAAGGGAEAVGYVEAHGTGTPVGDPIEVAALTQAFRGTSSARGYCALGSVKSNFGHTEQAAGVAGFIKAALMLQHRERVPSLNFVRPNPEIDFDTSPFYVCTESAPWSSPGGPRRAGVSAFGVGGTNAHVILEEAPAPARATGDTDWHPLVVSAESETALRAGAARLAEHLRAHPELAARDVAYTCNVRRPRRRLARSVVGRDALELAEQLEAGGDGVELPKASATGGVVWMFTGQGSQRANMGRRLYETERMFRDCVDDGAEVLRPELGADVRELLFPEPADTERCTLELSRTQLTQPVLFLFETALARLWLDRGVRPGALIGHSIGEYTAACLAGVVSFEDGLKLVARRAQLMQQLPGGSMLAIQLREEEARELVGERLDLAAVNAERRCVFSGETDAVRELADQLSRREVPHAVLRTSHAFHSRMIEPALAEFREALERVKLSQPSLAIVSNVTGTWLQAEQATDPAYWVRHARSPVRFGDGLNTALETRPALLLELGPGRELARLASSALELSPTTQVAASLARGRDDREALHEALGRAASAGVAVDWGRLYPDTECHNLRLPSYAFQRERCWVEPDSEGMLLALLRGDSVDIRGSHRTVASDLGSQAVVRLEPNDAPSLKLAGAGLVGAPEYARAIIETEGHAFGADPPALRDVWCRPLLHTPDAAIDLRVLATPARAGGREIRLFGRGPEGWELAASGTLEAGCDGPSGRRARTPAQVRERLRAADLASVRSTLWSVGLDVEPDAARFAALWVGEGELLAELHPAAGGAPAVPEVLAAVQQLVAIARPRATPCELELDRLDARPHAADGVWLHLELDGDGDVASGAARVIDAEGAPLVELSGLRARSTSGALEPELQRHLAQMQFEVAWAAAGEPRAPRADSMSARGTWIVLSDGSAVAAELVETLRERGGGCRVVEPPGGPDVESALASVDGELRGVIQVEDPGPEALESGSPLRASQRACLTLVSSVQACARSGREAVPLWVVTRGAQRVTGREPPLSPAPATLWGMARVVPLEGPAVRVGCIDLDPDGAEQGRLLANLLESGGDEEELALRDGLVHARRLVRASPRSVPARAKVRAGAAYLITGGTGGLGALFARWLAVQGATHLVLASRSGATAEAKVLADELAACGVRVDLESLDVTRRDEVDALIERLQPALRGVLHAAGVADARELAATDAEALHRVLAPKVDGAWNLHLATRDLELDWFGLFSSLSAVAGAPLLGGYAASNAFLDATAGHRQALGLPAVSIDWDAFADVGMAERSYREAGVLDRLRVQMLGPEEGTAVMGSLLDGAASQVVVLPARRRTLQLLPRSGESPLFAEVVERARRSGDVADAPRDAVERGIAFACAELLGVEGVGREESFCDLGGDSLLAQRLVARLGETFPVEISVGEFLERDTVAHVADLVRERVTAYVEQLPDEQAVELLTTLEETAPELGRLA